jgi:hypothetical protein
MKGKFEKIVSETPEGYFEIVSIKSDGQNYSIDFPKYIIDVLNEECIERAIECLRDALYRIRPDLRKM